VQVDAGDGGHATGDAARDTAGTRLRAAREAAGLSIDVVAQQLKLAPRQVQALEDDDFQRLPGRTFVRGFARNYARFLELDPDSIVSMLPASESAPALQRPALAADRRPMGEMPIEGASKQRGTRWLFALLIVVAFAGAGYYEYTRQHSGDGTSRSSASEASNAANAQRASPSGAATALPNPVASGASGSDTPSQSGPSALTTANPVAPSSPTSVSPPLSSPSSATSMTAPAAAPTTSATQAGSAAPSANVATQSSALTSPSSTTPASSSATQATTTEATLVLTFKGTSWAEVKDASGRVILQMTGGAGMTQTVSGTAPFELALGNAPEVGVSFRGQALDLSPYTRGSVARVALR
jgi:cytoskeleton protein RodZ